MHWLCQKYWAFVRENLRVAGGTLLVISDSPIEELKEWLEDYYRQILQTLEPERPGKNKERRRRLIA